MMMEEYIPMNPGNFMNFTEKFFKKKRKKTSILHYISIRFSGIILLMAVVMIAFTSYLSNTAIASDIRRQIRREIRSSSSSFTVRDGKAIFDENFNHDDNHVRKILLTKTGDIINGTYPEEKLSRFPVRRKDRPFRRIKCDSGYYYMLDLTVHKKDKATGEYRSFIIRGIGKASDFDSPYKTMKYSLYLFTFIIVFIGGILIIFVSRRLTLPMKDIEKITDQIRKDDDFLKQRIEYHSEFKEIDAMIEANNRLITQMEKLYESQKQFTSDVAHELRTPVSVIMAECQYIKKYGSDPSDYSEALSVIERQTKKTNQIIEQLLTLSRLDQGRIQNDFELADIREIVESVCANELLAAQKNITIRKDLEETFAFINVALFSSAVKNLINNALKYSNENSCIEVNLRTESAALAKENAAAPASAPAPKGDRKKKTAAGTVVFQVRDHGCGMSPAVLNHVFDRFYRADASRSSDGFGLGLSIVQKIVEYHHGLITVESMEGEGSTFTVYLPA